MRIVVTGASGFIGSQIVEKFKHEHEILCMSGKTKLLGCNFIMGDLNVISNLINEHDVFIHAAGQAHIKQNEQTRESFFKNNVGATKGALRLAFSSNVKHFVLLSSIAVLSTDENDIYAQTKRESEELVISFCEEHGMNYTIIRPVMVYGPTDKKGNMIKLIRQIKRGFFPMFNNGRVIKNIIFIENLIFIIQSILMNPIFYNRAINVADNETMTLKSICEEIKKGIGKSVFLIPVPRFMCLLLIQTIGFIQKFGVLSSLNKESVRKLLVDVNIQSENFNLPYSSHEALRNTVRAHSRAE